MQGSPVGETLSLSLAAVGGGFASGYMNSVLSIAVKNDRLRAGLLVGAGALITAMVPTLLAKAAGLGATATQGVMLVNDVLVKQQRPLRAGTLNASPEQMAYLTRKVRNAGRMYLQHPPMQGALPPVLNSAMPRVLNGRDGFGGNPNAGFGVFA